MYALPWMRSQFKPPPIRVVTEDGNQYKLCAARARARVHLTAAGDLNVRFDTVKFHMRHIYEKLQVHSKSEAVAKAMRERLIN
jgi:hypothetical protein